MRNFYEILGVDRTATTKQISTAYRNLAKAKHPDVGGNQQEFAEIARAADVLCDPAMREKYDSTGETERDLNGVDALALELLLGIFAQAIEKSLSPMASNMNLKLFVATQLETQKRAIHETKVQLQLRHEKLKSVAGSMKIKDNGLDLLAPRILGMASSITERLSKSDNDIATHERAQTILDCYDWTDDNPMQGFGVPQPLYIGGVRFR
jgi:curved DNA-binding protein CbpA